MIFRRFPNIENKAALYCAVFILYFFFGITTGFDAAAIVFAVLHGVFACILFVFMRKCDYCRTLAIVVLSAAFALLWAVFAKYVYYYPSERFLAVYEGKECGMVLRIDKVDSTGDTYGNYDCSILECNGKETESVFGIHPSIRLSCYGIDFVQKGDVVYLNGVVLRPEVETAGGFEEKAYLRSHHIFMNCDCRSGLVLMEKGNESFIDRLRAAISDNISKYVGKGNEAEEAIAKCMLLGDKTGVPKELKDIFRAAGLSHVLSVSGLHLSILFMTVSVFFGLYRRNMRRRFAVVELVSCLLVFMYMALANFTPSIMRAGFMLIIMNIFSARVFGRRKLYGYTSSDKGFGIERRYADEASPDTNGTYFGYVFGRVDRGIFNSVSALFLAGALIIVLSPWSVFDVGMQLSFMATLGILLAIHTFGKYTDNIRNVVLRAVVLSLLFTYSAVAFTLPICVYNFNALATLGAVSNLIVMPILTPLLALLLIIALMAFLPSGAFVTVICTILGFCAGILCRFCILCARTVSRLPFAVIGANRNIALVIVFAALVLFAFVSFLIGAKRAFKTGFLAVVALYFTYMHLLFINAIVDFGETKFSFCTVLQRPYFCVYSGNDRIIFDDCSGLASEHIIRESLGNRLYDTGNYYLCAPGKEADFESLYFNIENFVESDSIEVVLLPSKELCISADVDMEAYAEFLVKLSDTDLKFEFYSDNFDVCGVEFVADFGVDARSFVFDDTALVFAKKYDEFYADRISDGLQSCVYFCDKADDTDNYGYNSEAELYVSSPLWKKINGASGIPTRAPELLE